eukprot:gnl/MRDRNA2_/MRDRNA2_107986_c0_seq1.p1 gnl/MRDRNA2_/MRDRNA2_107986_c0~~gnl/MRDRNA2_/MRDRNA2_107986_c0_seq1.p1  ORF type:complete len:415 (-),score=64.20 gnl/MRDRNA2_/MRDRNA2_107986_c0_seq1:84-1328(-)
MFSGEPRPGDWDCPACGDLQFARNQRCRKCGEPNPENPPPESGGGGGVSKPGDWICPNCGDNVFARNLACRQCGTPKGAPNAKPGDWTCPNCGDNVFARNQACRQCGTPKPSFGGGGFGGKGGKKGGAKGPPKLALGMASNGQEGKPGDWTCPNCGDLVFARNDACRQCGMSRHMTVSRHGGGGYGGGKSGGDYGGGYTVRAGKGVSSKGSNGESMKPGDWICPDCGDLVFGKHDACRQCGAPKPNVASNGQVSKPGDWVCAECGDVVFSKNASCRQCGAPKPDGMDSPRGMASPRGGKGAPRGPFGAIAARAKGILGKGSNGQIAKPGDWICPNCNDVVFAKNASCRQCGTEKPEDGESMVPVGKNGQMLKPGDWVCPSCQDVQFARNQECRMCQTPKPEEGDRSRSPRGRGM